MRKAKKAPAGSTAYDGAIRDLAPRFEHRLFLSATPHNGHSNSFSALLELLEPAAPVAAAAPPAVAKKPAIAAAPKTTRERKPRHEGPPRIFVLDTNVLMHDPAADAAFGKQFAGKDEQRHGDQDEGLDPADEGQEDRLQRMAQALQRDDAAVLRARDDACRSAFTLCCC